MKRLLSVMVIGFLFIAASAYSEEPVVPKPDIMQAYNVLPDDPSAEQEAEFFRLLSDRAIVDITSTFPSGAADFFRSSGIREFDAAFFTTGVDPKTMKHKKIPWKSEILMFLGLRLWFEGKTVEPVTPDLEMKRFTVGCRSIMQTLRRIPDDRPRYAETEARRREMYRKYALENGILDRHERTVKEYRDRLEFRGDTVRERVEKWRVSVDALGARDYYPAAAHAAWLWDNVTLKDVLLKEVPDSIAVTSKTKIQDIAREYFADWFVSQDADLWGGNAPKANGPSSLRLAVRFCFSAISTNLRKGDASSQRSNLLWFALVPSFRDYIWMLPEPLYAKILTPARQAQNNQYTEQSRGSYGGLRLKLQRSFEGGGAWFAGKVLLEPDKKEVRVEKEFLYPQVQIRYGHDGLGILNQFEADPLMYPRLLGNNEFFLWQPYTDGIDDPPQLLKQWPVGEDVEYDLSPEGFAAAFGDGRSKRYFRGIQNVNLPGYSVKDLKQDFTPGVFYHYAATVCSLYTISAYEPDADYIFYDYPITVLIAQPETNAKPDEVIVGLKWNELDTWLGRCGLELKMKRMWNAAEWLEDKANADALTAADELYKKLEVDTKARWKAGREEAEKRKKAFWGE